MFKLLKIYKKFNNQTIKTKEKKALIVRQMQMIRFRSYKQQIRKFKISYTCYKGNILGCLSVETSCIFDLFRRAKSVSKNQPFIY